MTDEASSVVTPKVHVWSESGHVLAAAVVWQDGYYWCQSWPDEDLVERALTAAREWGVTPTSPPRVTEPLADIMVPLTWLRCLLPLADRGERFDSALFDWLTDAEVDRGTDLVRRLVASGLSERRTLVCLSWPSLDLEHVDARPGPPVEQRVSKPAGPVPPRAATSPMPDSEAPDGALPNDYSDRELSEAEFVAAVLDGARGPHLWTWANELLEAVERSAVEPPWEVGALGDFLRAAMDAMRAELNPFAAYLEAPPPITQLHKRHGEALQDLVGERDQTLSALLTDAATNYYRLLPAAPVWSSLVEADASPIRPDLPDEDW